MDITSDDYKDLRRNLQDQGSIAPREAIGALLLLGVPDQLITIQTIEVSDDAASWLLLAKMAGGLAVVEARSPTRWDITTHNPPEGAVVDAHWYPLSSVMGVGISEVKVWRDQSIQTGDFAVEATWSIGLQGRAEDVRVTRPPSNHDEDVVDNFCRGLIG